MHDESTSNHFQNGSRPRGLRLLEILCLPRRIYESLKGNVDVSGWEKKARITNNFACIKRTRNQVQSVDRMIHGAASGKCLREVLRRCTPLAPPRGWRSPEMVFCCRWFIRFALVTCEVISLTWRDVFHSAQQKGFKRPSRRSSWTLVLIKEAQPF